MKRLFKILEWKILKYKLWYIFYDLQIKNKINSTSWNFWMILAGIYQKDPEHQTLTIFYFHPKWVFEKLYNFWQVQSTYKLASAVNDEVDLKDRDLYAGCAGLFHATDWSSLIFSHHVLNKSKYIHMVKNLNGTRRFKIISKYPFPP